MQASVDSNTTCLHVKNSAFYAESGGYCLADALAGVLAKLHRRHPHVDFVSGTHKPMTAQEEQEQWEAVKRATKAAAAKAGESKISALSGVPKAQPSLSKYQTLVNSTFHFIVLS